MGIAAEREGGFTLVELIIALMIVTILLVIGLIVLLTMNDRAQDRSAQADVRTAIIVQKAHWVDEGDYTDDQGVVLDYAPGFAINTSDPGDSGVYVDLHASETVVCVHQESDSGAVFTAYLDGLEAVQFGQFDNSGDALAFACDGTDPGWSTEGW